MGSFDELPQKELLHLEKVPSSEQLIKPEIEEKNAQIVIKWFLTI